MELAKKFGATDRVMSSGEETIGRVREMTRGGVQAVLECVGTSDSLNTAIGICRPGGLAGVPEGYRAMDTRRAIKVMVMV